LKITTEDLGQRQVRLTIEVDEERVERALQGVARRLSREHSFPGFRRGRAPYHVILGRFGREVLLREVLDDLGQEVVEEALEREALELYSAGELEEVQLDPLLLKLRLPLRPSVDLGAYRELRVEPPVVSVDEAEIDTELERLRQASAILEPAGDRPAQMGDWVSLDVSAAEGGEPYILEEAFSAVLDAENDSFAPGFSGQVLGMRAGEEKSFALTLSGAEEAGEEPVEREMVFTVRLREVRSRTLPGLDDDLARTVGDFDTLEELRQEIRRRLEERAQLEADQSYGEEVLEALVAGATIAYPPDLINDQVERMVKRLEGRLKDQGLTLDDFFKLSGQTEEAYRESLRPQAERDLRLSMALGELARLEKLDVAEDEVDRHIALVSATWGERAGEVQRMLSSPEGVRSIANDLLSDKAIQCLVAIARGEAPPLEGEEGEPVAEPEGVPSEIGAIAAEALERVAEEPAGMKASQGQGEEAEAFSGAEPSEPDVEAD
jgi:trigger factor